MAEPTELLSMQAAAAIIGVTDERVRQLVVAGQLPAKRIGARVFIQRADIEAFAALPPGRGGHRRLIGDGTWNLPPESRRPSRRRGI